MVSHIFDDEFDISREFLDAWQNDELVFFVGAGVSMYEPTNLPSFAELTKKFCDKAGKSDCFYKTGGKKKTKLSEDEILNKLERDSHPVHKWANFDFLPEEKIKVNNLQDLIVKISTAQGRTFRIITTNYDNCLSKVIQNQKMNIREYAAPALPLGRKFAGLVYLHGKAGEYEDGNNLVLTSSDFGKAYLTDAYASRFLDEVFKNYTVCFVGYSCNDVIVDRLTRGINSEKKHFAIVEKDFDVWEERDITPIKFTVNKNDYSKEEDLLQKISEIVLETTDLQAKRIDELISSSTPSVLEISENGKLKYMENVLKKNDVSVFDFIKFLESGSEEVSSKLKILNIFSNSVCKSGFFNEWLEWVFSQKLNCIDILCKKIQLKNSYYPVLPFSETIIRGLVSRGDSIFEIIESMFVGHGGMMNDSLICEIITRVLTNKNSYKKKVKINSKITSFLCQVLIPQLSLKCNSNYFGFYLKDLEWKGNENVILTYFLRIFEPFVTYDIGISNSYYQKVGTIYDKYHFGSLSKFLKNNHLDVNFNERFYLQIKKIYFRYSDFLENNVVLGDGLFRVQECIDRINHYLRPVHDAYITCVSNIPKVKTDTELVELFSFDREEMQALGLDVLEVLLENNRLLRSRKYIDLIIEKRIFETSEFASKIIKIIKKNQIKLTKTQQDKIIKVINSKPLKMRNHEFYQKPENIEEWRYRMLLNFSKLDYFDKVKELKIQHKIKYP
ncbi:MAG: SIR2 family protein, partial [Candidatus Ancillula sp.]|nr:SIR2 family protein [Candidatus Ancillula sp.]